MKIAVLGAGRVGSTLGRLWHAAGHDVTFAARHATRPRALAAELGERAHAASVADAVAAAEVVLVAVPGPAVTDVLQAAGPLDGRVMIDAANSFGQQQMTLRSLADAFPRRAGCAPSTRSRSTSWPTTTTASRLGSCSCPATRRPSRSSPS